MFKRLVVVAAIVAAISGQFFVPGVFVQSAYALGTPQITVIDPPSPQPVGACIRVRARVDWDSEFRSMRMRFGNEGWQEEATPEFERTFCTSGYGPGWYTIRIEVARQGDNSWSSPTSAEASYQLTEVHVPPTSVPAPTPSCQINSFDVWPSPAVRGEDVRITGSGSCNTGVRAMRVKIDGGALYEIGAPSLDTTWHTSGASEGWHDVSIEIAGWGDDNWSYAAVSSRSIQLTSPSQPTQPPSSTHFSTGDVIQIGYDVFVIVNGERRLVPNPETLDALGIPRSWIDNEGLSDAQLRDIPRGPDIPDVVRDPSGFQAFKNWIFPNTSPIVPATTTPRPASGGQQTGSFSFTVSPTSVVPGGAVTVCWSGYNPDGNDWISMHPAGRPDSEYLTWQYARGSSGSLTFTAPQEPGWYDFRLFRNGPKFATSNQFRVVAGSSGDNGSSGPAPFLDNWTAGSTTRPEGLVGSVSAAEPNPFAEGQCTHFVYDQRPDVGDWIVTGADTGVRGTGNAENWDNHAQNQGIPVDRGNFSLARPGDIVVWEGSCGVGSSAGHVAILVRVDGNDLVVNEANHCRWNEAQRLVECDGREHWGSVYHDVDPSCVSFIHQPSGSNSSPGEGGSQSLWQAIWDWLKSLWPW